MGNSFSPGCRWWCLLLRILSPFPLDVLDYISDVIESASEGFLTYSEIDMCLKDTEPPPSTLSNMANGLRYWLCQIKADLYNIEKTNEVPLGIKQTFISYALKP